MLPFAGSVSPSTFYFERYTLRGDELRASWMSLFPTAQGPVVNVELSPSLYLKLYPDLMLFYGAVALVALSGLASQVGMLSYLARMLCKT